MSLLEEKDAIREVLAEYCFRLDGGDYDGMAALFTEDGTWETAFGKGTGRAAIAQHARDIRAQGRRQSPARNPSRDQYRHQARRRYGRGALELDRRAEQPGRAEDRLRRRLRRPDGETGRRLAVPLPQDRPLHRRLIRRARPRLGLVMIHPFVSRIIGVADPVVPLVTCRESGGFEAELTLDAGGLAFASAFWYKYRTYGAGWNWFGLLPPQGHYRDRHCADPRARLAETKQSRWNRQSLSRACRPFAVHFL